MKNHKKLLSLVLVLCLLLSIGVAAYAASGFTMTYLPGTSDTVTNMPDADSGVGGQPYTVSDKIPQREGYEFLGWTLGYGVEDPVVNYKNAIDSFSKTAVAAAAGDSNLYRRYTITMKASVDIYTNMPADKAAELYIENLTMTDTVQDEFKVDANSFKAKIADDAGIIVSDGAVTADVADNLDGSTTVSYDFGNIKNYYSVELSFEITAKPDFIGSNNVFTNVWKPKASYSHSIWTLTQDYTVEAYSTPEVNVPICFEVGDGSEIEVAVGEEVDFASLDSEQIVNKAHEMATHYDQINGTLSYEWELPDGTSVKVPATVHITNGVPDEAFPDEAALSHVFTPDEVGHYIAKLHVTFTPDAAVDSGNFADSATAEPVFAKTGAGSVGVIAEDPRTSYVVRYVDRTGADIATHIKVFDQLVGDTVTKEAIAIDNYDLDDESVKTLTLQNGENEIIFYYKPAVANYTVRYVYEDWETGEYVDIIPPETGSGNVGSTITKTKIEFDGYTYLGTSTRARLTLSRDDDKNVIIFEYAQQV